MKRHDWALYTLGIGFGVWAISMLAGRLIPTSTDGVKVLELILAGAGAFGTLAAVVVALVLAARASQKEARRAEALGRIAAARLLSHLESFRLHLDTFCAVFHHDFDEIAKHSIAKRLIEQGADAWSRFDGFDPHQLLGLFEDHTVALAILIERLRLIRAEVVLFDEGTFENMPIQVRQGMVQGWTAGADLSNAEFKVILDAVRNEVSI